MSPHFFFTYNTRKSPATNVITLECLLKYKLKPFQGKIYTYVGVFCSVRLCGLCVGEGWSVWVLDGL